MSVHYKFKSALDFDTITFDGLHISVEDLKKAIVHQKRLGKTAEFDLQITNAQTKEEYTDETALIPKNTSLIIARIPLARQPKKPWDPSADKQPHIRVQNDSDATNVDLSRMNGTEEDKINAMIAQSTVDYDPNNYQKIRGANQTGEVPLNYRCYKCHKPGHWIKNCPLNSSTEMVDIKRNTGIPRSFIDGQNEVQPVPVPPAEKKTEIPEDLICSICKDLFTDAVMIPCCGSSFCDECVRTALIESEDNECPDCKEKGSSPGSLIPNRFLRNSVNAFKNETGYTKLRPPPKPQPEKVVEEKAPEIEQQKIENKPEEEDNTVQKEKATEGSNKEHRPETPHDESDFEDNITVTVPPPHLQSGEAFRDRHLNGRHGRAVQPPGMDTPPKSGLTGQQHQHINQEDRSATPTIDEKEGYSNEPSKNLPEPHQPYPSTAIHNVPHMNERPDQYQHGLNPYPPNLPPRHFDGGYGHPPQNYPHRPYDQHGMHRLPYPHRGGPYHGQPMQHQIRPRHVAPPPGSVASVFQGVAAKIGSGIIDDPLEAFNRIMREKERRKEERRSSPSVRRRSRSIEMGRRRSPLMDRRRSPRMRSPDVRRIRSPDNMRRGRSIERRSEERRRKRSNSYDTRVSRQSRSFSRSRSRSIRRGSRSPMQRKRSRSPIIRRSRSRSASFSISRSRSRSISPGRYRAPIHTRYNRSPLATRGSPRNRFRDRRQDRRDEYHRDRDEYRDRSPGYQNYHRGRGNFRGRGGNRGTYRHDRSAMQHDQYYQQGPAQGSSQQMSQSQGGYHDGSQYVLPSNRYNMPPRGLSPMPMQAQPQRLSDYLPPATHIVPLSQPPPGPARYENDMYRNRFDDIPPGTEPPPPGFENDSMNRYSRERETWTIKPNDVDRPRDVFRRSPETSNIQSYENRTMSPETRDRANLEHTANRRSTSRSNADHPRTSDHRSAERLDKRRKSRTPHRESRREKDSSRDKLKEYDKHDKDKKDERKDHEKSSKHDRDRNTRDKPRDVEKKDKEQEKENRREREKDKDKEKEKEKDKDKKKDSSDDEKRERKNKEKKKKRKEEKALEKKKKKERKEKEKREKELRKEQARARKLLEARIEQDVEEEDDEDERDADDAEEHTSTPVKKQRQSATEDDDEDEEKETVSESIKPSRECPILENSEHDKTPELKCPVENINQNEDENQEVKGLEDIEEGELPVSEGDRSPHQKLTALLKTNTAADNNAQIDDLYDENIDLYADIIDSNLNINYPDMDEQKVKRNEITNTSHSPHTLNRSDSILDIHANLDFDHEIDDLEPEVSKKATSSFLPIPEPSKWERDEEMLSANEKVSGSDASPYEEQAPGKVTNEVLKRAENAIFARAINAIRPIEIKKISVERQKLYANEKNVKEDTPVSSVVVKASTPTKEMHFQITVPVNSANPERSVEIKTDLKLEQTNMKTPPVRSVKDRLGSKITDLPRSRTRTPPRKIILESSNHDHRRSNSRDHKSSREDRSKEPTNTRKSSKSRGEVRKNDESNKRDGSGRDRERDRDRDRNRDFTRDRDRDKDREKEKDKDKEKEKDKDKDKDRDNDKDKNRDRKDSSRNKEREKTRDRRKSPDPSTRDRDREKEQEKARQLARNRENERMKELSNRDNDKSNKSKESKRDRSSSRDKNERSEKRHKKDDKNKRPEDTKIGLMQSETSSNRKFEKTIELKLPTKNHSSERKKSVIDEANFIPDYDEQLDVEQNDLEKKKIRELELKTKIKIGEELQLPKRDRHAEKKRTRSPSSSSSSTDSNSSDSSSDSEDNKRRKKRKHKKQKKTKRVSSSDSESSPKKKKSKRKKSKKKKKTKK